MNYSILGMRYVVISCILLISAILNVQAQERQSLTLLDSETNKPVTNVQFIYGQQIGESDEQGVIRFDFTPGVNMELSGLNYDLTTWNEAEIKALLKNGTAYLNYSPIDLFPVTVISVRASQQPHKRLKIDQQDRLAHDAATILNRSAAFNSIRKGGNYGFDPVFRGFKYDQLNVVFNGAQSATAACPNRMDPPTSQMAPNMIERIEVLKGPYALRFGTGFGATINFIPSAAEFTDSTSISGRLGSSFEGNGNVTRTEGRVRLTGKKYDLSIFSTWSEGDDYTDGNGQQVQADFKRGNFGTSLGLKLTGNQELNISAIYNLARDTDFPALAMDLREDDTWMFNARHDIGFNRENLQSVNTTIYASFVDHLMDNLLKPLDPRMLNAQTSAKTHNYGGRSEGLWRFDNRTLYAGIDLRVEGAEGIRVREFIMGPNAGKIFLDNAWQDSRISRTGAFGEYRFNLGAYQLTFSGRLELNTATVNDINEEFITVNGQGDVTQFNPSFSAGVLHHLNNTMRLGLWLGRAQRSAGLTERFINYFPVGQDPFEMLGNPNLDPEVNNQADLTFNWNTASTDLEVNIFGAYLDDYISSVIVPELEPRLPNSPGVRQYINISNAVKTGFEINWNQYLGLGLNQQLGLAYTYGKDLERDEPLPEIPPLDIRYSLSGSYVDGKLRPEVSIRHVLEQDRISTEFGENTTPSFSVIDLRLGYQLTDMIRISAAVNNLLDEYYFEHLNRSVRGQNEPIYARGRNFRAMVNIGF